MEVTNTQDTNITENILASSQTNTPIESAAEVSSLSGFAKFIQSALGKSETSEVNEEELFASIIKERLQKANPEAAEYYDKETQNLASSFTRKDGYRYVEDLAVAALKSTVSAGKIDKETAERINGEAFAAAQLDSNLDVLWDGRGSASDPTIAVAKMNEAMRLISEAMEKIESGDLQTASRSLETTPDSASKSLVASAPSASSLSSGTSQSLDGAGGFVWKPISDADGKLIVLLPTELNKLVSNVGVYSQLPPDDIFKLGEGRFTGDTHNGNRGHYRFDKPGAEYGDNVHVVAFKKDGSYVSWDISKGSDRHD